MAAINQLRDHLQKLGDYESEPEVKENIKIGIFEGAFESNCAVNMHKV